MTDPKAAQTELVARLHGILDDEPTTRVISMFGSRAFMVRDKMVCCALKGGHLLAHVDPNDDAKLSREPGASPAEMGPGREMGPGWIQVAAEMITNDDRLRFWVDVCMAFNRAQTIGSKPS